MFGKSALDLWRAFEVNDCLGLVTDGTYTLFASVAMADQMCRPFYDVRDVSMDVVGLTVEEVCKEKDV